VAADLIRALLSRYYLDCVGCDKSSRLLSMLAYVALLSRYYLVCVGCDKSSRLLSMLAYVALAYVHPLYRGVS